MAVSDEVKVGIGQARIHIPVALPPQFLGAPQIPAFMWAGCCLTSMMGFFINPNYIWYGLLALFVWFPGHGFLIFQGRREPHLSSLLQVYTRGGTKARARAIGRRRRRRKAFYPG